jgi:dimeric dUTPase (all-alpha-NTP-PPase superfamily)
VNFKWWKNPQPVDRERVKEELVDILHFFVSMCLKCDISPEELYQGYLSQE